MCNVFVVELILFAVYSFCIGEKTLRYRTTWMKLNEIKVPNSIPY